MNPKNKNTYMGRSAHYRNAWTPLPPLASDEAVRRAAGAARQVELTGATNDERREPSDPSTVSADPDPQA